MKTPHLSKPDLTYVSSLAKAGWDGVVTAPKEPVRAGSRALWAPFVIGAGVGVLGACLGSKRRSARHLVLGGLLGTVVGLSGGMAWASRDYTEGVARNVRRKVNTVRDAHWLEKNPIAYA